MKALPLLVAVIATLVICTAARAEKLKVDLTSDSLKSEGFSVVTAKGDDNTMNVTLTRDLSKARSFDAGSDLELVRGATLEVAGSQGMIVRCQLEPEAGPGSVIYRFTIARDYLPHSRVTVAEIDDYKKSLNREHLIGGGTFFEINLAEIAKP